MVAANSQSPSTEPTECNNSPWLLCKYRQQEAATKSHPSYFKELIFRKSAEVFLSAGGSIYEEGSPLLLPDQENHAAEWQLFICFHEMMLQSSDRHVAGLLVPQYKNSASHITYVKK